MSNQAGTVERHEFADDWPAEFELPDPVHVVKLDKTTRNAHEREASGVPPAHTDERCPSCNALIDTGGHCRCSN